MHIIIVHLFMYRVTLSFGKKSGSEFDRGFHSITYEAVDDGGQRASCSFSFTVEGIYKWNEWLSADNISVKWISTWVEHTV